MCGRGGDLFQGLQFARRPSALRRVTELLCQASGTPTHLAFDGLELAGEQFAHWHTEDRLVGQGGSQRRLTPDSFQPADLRAAVAAQQSRNVILGKPGTLAIRPQVIGQFRGRAHGKQQAGNVAACAFHTNPTGEPPKAGNLAGSGKLAGNALPRPRVRKASDLMLRAATRPV